MTTRAKCLTVVALLVIALAASAAADDLTELRREYADVLALSGPAKAEVLALARVLRERRAMAIDFSHLDSPQYCLNSGGDMLHVATDPKSKVPLAYMHPAQPLLAAGLDVSKLRTEPETSAELEPDTWYYYPGGGRVEPLHGKAMPPMLIRTVGSR